MNQLAVVGLIACGIAGGALGIRFRIPLGGLIGSIVGAATFHLMVSEAPPFGRGFVLVTQVLVGTIVGASVSRSVVATLTRLWLPALTFCLCMPVIGLVVGWLLMARVGHVNLLTAFLASAPAGAMEMSAAALAFGADTEAVLAAQVMRVLAITVFGATVLPLIVRRFGGRGPSQSAE